MNNVLALILKQLTALLAVAIVGISAFVGNFFFPHDAIGYVLGLVAGFIGAVVCSGLLALLIEIHSELVAIRKVITTAPAPAAISASLKPERVAPRF